MKQMSLSEKVTYSTVRIECKDAIGQLSIGTGFIMNVYTNDLRVPIIITNKHVTANCIETSFEFCKADANGDPIDTDPFNIKIHNGNAWRNHPNNNIDLCFLPLQSVLDEIQRVGGHIFYVPLESNTIADEPFLTTLCAIEEVVMVGYPQGLMDTYNHKPVIRKGITATHPKNNYMGKSEILLDIAAYPGSSGSPVFILNEGTYFVGNTLQVGARIRLLGILYAGPQYEATGTITFSNLPVKPIPRISIPFNLGIAIKAKEIKGIEEYIKQVLDRKETIQ